MNDVRSVATGDGVDPTYSVLAEISREMVRLSVSKGAGFHQRHGHRKGRCG
ncbi:MAG TPA: hypothetical protein VN758_08940 [Solirubrobacterales bacterium]|nr:hypothetical protein [Solirubrobacterales bacterium]